MEPRDMQYIHMRSLQERPITLGELLLREEAMDDEDPIPLPRPMGRTMSPTRCLGSLANGRPRRARGRTVTRPSTSEEPLDEDSGETHLSRRSQQRRRRGTPAPMNLPAVSRWRIANAEARIRNFHSLMNRSRSTERRSTSGSGSRLRQRSLERSDSPDIFYNPFSWQRRRGNSVMGRRTRSRSASTIGTRSRSTLRSHLASHRYMLEGRPHSGRTDPETRRNAPQTSGSSVSDPARRFINFAAEFIPVKEQPEDAEPPEWSLNVTAADFGPFAVGRSALSRARSLAIMGALSQVKEDSTDTDSSPNEN